MNITTIVISMDIATVIPAVMVVRIVTVSRIALLTSVIIVLCTIVLCFHHYYDHYCYCYSYLLGFVSLRSRPLSPPALGLISSGRITERSRNGPVWGLGLGNPKP